MKQYNRKWPNKNLKNDTLGDDYHADLRPLQNREHPNISLGDIFRWIFPWYTSHKWG